MPFVPGDRVYLSVRARETGNEDWMWQGITGTVVVSEGDAVGVEWDEDIHGNDCDGRCKNGRGWYVGHNQLKYICEGFRIGDVVSANDDYIEGNGGIMRGNTGTVVWISDKGYVGVDWGKDIGGHDCCGHCHHSQGWNVKGRDVSLVYRPSDDEEFEQADDSSLTELLFGKAV